jgi:hypothetical protein
MLDGDLFTFCGGNSGKGEALAIIMSIFFGPAGARRGPDMYGAYSAFNSGLNVETFNFIHGSIVGGDVTKIPFCAKQHRS